MSKNDKELLELAARAVDNSLNWSARGDFCWLTKPRQSDCNTDAPWDPLNDDGDALRLAVKAGVSYGIDAKSGSVKVMWVNCDTHSLTMPHNECQYSVPLCERIWLRRAIVRAAAQIGATL